VAVGTSRLASMLATMRAAAPRSGVPSGAVALVGAVTDGDVVAAGVGRTGAATPFEVPFAGTDVEPFVVPFTEAEVPGA